MGLIILDSSGAAVPAPVPGTGALRLFVAGTEYGFLNNSMNGSDDMNARNTLEFTLVDETGAYSFQVGQEVILLGTDGVREFGGTIEDIDVELYGTGVEFYRITCVDFNQYADRFLVAEAFEEGISASAMVEALRAIYLASEGVHAGTGTIEGDDILLPPMVFDYQYLSEVLNRISELAGPAWEIDYYKQFHFRRRETLLAPFAITVANDVDQKVSVRSSRGSYRTRQYIRGGDDVTDPVTETFVGDGERKTFNVGFNVAKVPTILVNGVNQGVIGIRGVSLADAHEWFWNEGAAEISQKETAAALTANDVLSVTYQGQIPIFIQGQDEDEIARRAAIEGGSGIYEAIEIESSITNTDFAVEAAIAKLRLHGFIRREVKIETMTPGLRSGQLLPIDIPRLGLDGDFLIQSVSMNDLEGKTFHYTVTALDGEALGGWTTFYQRLLAARREAMPSSENEKLTKLRTLYDTVAMGDSFATPLQGAKETRIGFAKIGESEVGTTP